MNRRGLSKWLVIWALAGAAGGEPHSVSFDLRTDPPDAVVYLARRGAEEIPPEEIARYGLPEHFRGRYGGVSGPLLIEFPGDEQSVEAWVVHPLCKPMTLALVRNVTPPQQLLTLEYRDPNQRLLALAGRYRWPLLALLLMLGGPPLFFLVTHRRRVQALQSRELEAAAQEERLARMVVPDEGDPFVGKRLDSYRVLERLGQGGMARVYRAVPEESLSESEAVAIKVLNTEMGRDPELMKRFEREKRVYEQLHHPHIVRVLASGDCQGQPYLVMELVRGTTLRAYVLPEGLPPRRVLTLMEPVFLAVALAHRRGIAHRDLKPENIMMTDLGVVKVMDFGLARGSHFSRVTETGSILGTPAYMAPEQIEGKFDVRSDQYALGVMLYEMLSGKLPFFDENPVTIVISHLSRPVPPLASHKSELEKVGAVVERMLAKNPDERYRDLDHALTSLRYAIS